MRRVEKRWKDLERGAKIVENSWEKLWKELKRAETCEKGCEEPRSRCHGWQDWNEKRTYSQNRVEQAPCHFVRLCKFYGSHFEFNFFLDLVEAPTFFSTGVVSAKVLLQVASVATLTAISYFHFVRFLSCSTFMCFLVLMW
jgi:hypothetical protein